MINNIRISIICVCFIGAIHPIFSQASWDIQYNSISELDDTFKGKSILLDFKSNENDTIINVLNIKKKPMTGHNRTRHLLLSSYDEVELFILDRDVIFVENWKIYDDMASLNSQTYLNKSNKNEFIKDVYLVKIVGDTICLKGNLYTSKKDFTPIEFEVDKSKVKGFLTRM